MWHRNHNHSHFAKHFTKWLQLHQRSHFTRVATAVLATAKALPKGPKVWLYRLTKQEHYLPSPEEGGTQGGLRCFRTKAPCMLVVMLNKISEIRVLHVNINSHSGCHTNNYVFMCHLLTGYLYPLSAEATWITQGR
jgi:hypothetical protein